MAKRVVSSLGVHEKNPMKRTKKKKLLEKVVNYLKSDSYLFAPLFSSQPSDFSPTKTISATQSGIEIKKPFEEENKNLLIKVGEYLKSDCYMYAPLIVPQPAFSTATISVSYHRRGRASEPRKVATGIATEKVTEKTKHPAQETARKSREDQQKDGYPPARRPVVRRTLVQRETVKHVVQQNCHPSSTSGKGLLETEPGKLVVE